MREKDQLFFGSVLIALAASVASWINTYMAARDPVAYLLGGSPIQLGLYSLSPWIALVFPFALTGGLYWAYKREEDAGLVLVGVWFGIALFDVAVRVNSLIW